MITAVATGALGTLLALGAWERYACRQARAAVAVRVHVNGTRGKSTVTRLIAAGLRASGRRTLAKTTGTAARVIGCDGRETPVRRRGPANIREQIWILREARRAGAEALVVECMAIDPALQLVSEREILAATIGVITNARPDHADVMGDSPASVAAALAHTIPARGLLVIGPDLDPAFVRADAHRLETTVQQASVSSIAPGLAATLPAWALANMATALAVTRALGVPDETAWPAMMAAAPDPGAVCRHVADRPTHAVTLVDASAANDPVSLGQILDGTPPHARVYVFNHRADRPLRLRQFAAAPPWDAADALLLTGDAPDRASRRMLDAGRTRPVTHVPPSRLPDALAAFTGTCAGPVTFVLCGNSRGLDAAGLAAALGQTGVHARG